MSLLEVLAALGLLAVVVGSALVVGEEMGSRLRLNSATRQIIMDLKLVRARAMTEGANYRLRFAEHATTYQRQRREGRRRYVDDGPAIELPSGIEVVGCTARGSAVTFRPRGHASTFGTITLASRDAVRQVVVDIAGRMRVR